MASEEEEISEDEEKDCITIAHSDAIAFVKESLRDLMKDPLLCDLPPEPTFEEISSQLALEHGRAIAVNVRQQDERGTLLPIVVIPEATVLDLKKAIQRHITLRQERRGGTCKISWKYVWKTYWLVFEGEKLADDNKPIKEYGIRSRDEITFAKRLRWK